MNLFFRTAYQIVFFLTGLVAAPANSATSPVLIKTLHDACVRDMVLQVCSAMAPLAKGSSTAKPGATVYVTGVGTLDAQSYERIRSYGQDMCQHITKSCTENWQGAACKTARQLYRQ